MAVGAVESDAAAADVNKKSLGDFRIAKPIIDALLRQWSGVEFVVLESRKMRRQRVDLEALRAQGKLDSHEKYIGVRVIDNNIQKDVPPYISYLKQSRRFAIFQPAGTTVPSDTVAQLESEFSRVLRYSGWEFDYIRWIDGAQLHGYDWLETLYDDTKPGRVAINHVGCIDLVYDMAVKDIQDSRVVMRRYRPTLVMLDRLAQQNGFDEELVKQVRVKIRESLGSVATEAPDFHQDGSAVHLYKVMYKEQGVIQVAWYCKNIEAGWLREPRVLWNGVKEQVTTMVVDPTLGIPLPQQTWERSPETQYPYHVFRYKITEDPCIAQTQGRGEMDLHLQEASCSTWSAFINQAWSSSRVMWSPSAQDPTVGGTAPRQLNVIIKNGAIWDRPMQAFTPPPPDPMMPKAIELLEMRNSDNINQPSWTVNNRQDSRKTAREVDAAAQQQSSLNSVQVVVLSVSMQSVLNAAWRIVRSQVMQGNIAFLVPPEVVGGCEWMLTPAGDVDYVEREEVVQKMQQDWPVVQNTGAAQVFLEEYFRTRYPKTAERYIEAMKAGDQKKQVVQQLATLLKTAVTDETGALKPEWSTHAAELQQIQAQTQQVLQQP